MPEVPEEIRNQLIKLCTQLDRRAETCAILGRYYEGSSPLPPAIVQARVTKAYRILMPLADAPWGSLIVDSTQDRLEVAGIRDEKEDVAKSAWEVWQDNMMDAESKIGHNSTLVDGRSFAMIWRSPEDEYPKISLDDSSTMIVQYQEGSRRERVAALRRWMGEDDRPYATLYRPDGVFKFVGPKNTSGRGGTQWEARVPDGEDWPMENPWKVVPVVELAVNRRLRRGTFGHARGEFEHCVGLIDRINLLTFLGLVVAFYMGFPLRGTIGERLQRKLLVDDHGDPLIDPNTGKQATEAVPPFDSNASGQFALENPEAKTAEFKAADRGILAVFDELDQLSTITKTPRHYFPMASGMSNLSADAIRASEGSLHAKVTAHKATLGEGWEEVLRIGGLMAKQPFTLTNRAELLWKDHESRSLSERADAAGKLKDILPWQPLAEKILGATQDEITRWSAQRGSDVMGALAAAAAVPGTPTPAVPPAGPPVSGNGSG